ncbi:MAG: hypothetical protein ACKVTZ_10820 [Bacteroidia bacterium]
MTKAISYLFLCLFLLATFPVKAQEKAPSKWRGSLIIGQYSAKIGMPSFQPFRLGVQGCASYHLNKNEKHQLRQSVHLGGFTHRYLQTAVRLYSEFQYEWHFYKGLFLNPLAIGAGYVASFSEMTSLKWDGNQYIETPTSLRHNFMISLGPNLGYESSLKVTNRPVTFSLGYRLQVQGIVVRNTVPVMAYSSLQLGAGVPF